MKRLILILTIFVVAWGTVACAENPVGCLFKNQYTIVSVADNIKVVTVENGSWEIIVRYWFGGKHSDPWQVLGFYLAYEKRHVRLPSTYTYWIFVRARYEKGCTHYDAQEVTEMVLGHEFMHIINHQQWAKGKEQPYNIEGKKK